MLVIIPCGGKKREIRCIASLMYIGNYHTACQNYALSITTSESILILSAKYGFLSLLDMIDPYELRMENEGSISARQLFDQATNRRILTEQEVIVLGGRDYTNPCKKIWTKCKTPLATIGTIGKQLAWLKKNTIN